ncbi:MAG: hypothetical protein OXR73_16810 [Myxococcales bacterium]|nr:hypothetical protein [Myxococcales bacterium]
MWASTLTIPAVWLLMLVPGAALVVGCGLFDRRSGLMGLVAPGYLATFCLLSPVSIGGYWLRAPLAVFTFFLGALILAGTAFWAWRVSALWRLWRSRGTPPHPRPRRGWRPGWEDVVSLMGVALLGLELAASYANGGYRYGDALYHIARVRNLADQGLNNWDIFFFEGYFARIYHTNLYHALLAAVRTMTGQHQGTVWMCTLPWAKLVSIAGGYYLGWAVFQRRWLAWCVAVAVLVSRAESRLILYPNQFATLWLGALALAFAVELSLRQRDWVGVVKLTAVALVTAQVHALYALYEIMIVGPILLVAAAAAARRGGGARGARMPLLALIGVCACLPLVYLASRGSAVPEARPPLGPHPIASVQRQRDLEKSPPVQREADRPVSAKQTRVRAPKPTRFTQVVGQYRVLRVRSDLFPPTGASFMSMALMLAGLLLARQWALGLLFVGASSVLCYMYLPPLSDLLLGAVGRSDWILERIRAYLFLFRAVCLPAALFMWLPARLGRRLSPLLFVATFCGYWGPPYSKRALARTEHFAKAGHWEIPQKRARRYERATARLRKVTPGGGVILAYEHETKHMATNHNLFFLATAPRTSAPGIPHKSQRLKDMKAIMNGDTDETLRAQLLRYYRVRFVHLGHPTNKRRRVKRRMGKLFGPMTKQLRTIRRRTVVELDPRKVEALAERKRTRP